MGTATYSRLSLGIAAAVLLLAGCGGHGPRRAGGETTVTGGETTTAATKHNTTFAWLRPAAPPPGWPSARIPSGAAMSYPPGWVRIHGDPGTATVALFGAHHGYVGYLNLTPRQGAETLGNWGHFRVDHNADEGDRNISTRAVALRRALRGATGSCVEDAYTTATGARYAELACLIEGRRTSAVIVGASPPDDWPRIEPLLERAITSVVAA
jgi:hypothetical protein